VKKKLWIFSLFFPLIAFHGKSQEDTLPIHLKEPVVDSLAQQRDLMDAIKKLFNAKPADTTKKKSNVTILPAIGYNPSIGFLIGINFLKAFYMGDPATTKLSVGQVVLSYTTKNLIITIFRTNISTKDKKWNL